MSVSRALALCTMIAWTTLAGVLAPEAGLAQERGSLVTTRLEVTGEVRRKLSLSVEDLRGLAQRRGQASAGGYGGIRLTDLLEEADIKRDARHALRRTYVVATASDGYHAVFSWASCSTRLSDATSWSRSSGTGLRCRTAREESRSSRSPARKSARAT